MSARALPLRNSALTVRRAMPASALALAGASLIAIAFFLPWVQGDGVFAMREFSGFGFAGALHNVTTGLATTGAGSFAPMLFYALPAGAAGVGLLVVLGGPSVVTRALSLILATYALMLIAGVLVLGLTPVTDATGLLGSPSWGLGLTMLGAVILLLDGLVPQRDGSS